MGKHKDNTVKKQVAIQKLSNFIFHIKNEPDSFSANKIAKNYGIYNVTVTTMKKLGYLLPAGSAKGHGSKFNHRKKLNDLNKVCLNILKKTYIVQKNYGKSPYIPLN